MRSKQVLLKYGEREIEARLDCKSEPELLAPPSIDSVANETDIIRRALDHPIGSSVLRENVSSGDKVVIIASDSTRVTGSHVFLPVIVEELNRAGIPDRDITILIALGIHREQTKEEHLRLLGAELYRRICPLDHDARDPENLVSIGSTTRGTEVVVNRRVAEAGKVILTGAVVPHYYAGFGGGRKSIMPGVCSLKANLQSHMLVFNPPPATGRNPGARTALLAGNPVHEDMVEAARMVHPAFMLNTVAAPRNVLASAFAGDFIRAHESACEYFLENLTVTVDVLADLSIVSCGGYPKDMNFIQAHKAIHSACSVTKPGGWMIVLAECADGFGYPGFIDWFRFSAIEQFEQELRANYEIYGQTAYSVYEKAREVNIVLVSSLNPSDVGAMKMHHAHSFDGAFRIARKNLPDDFITYIIPAASNTLFLTKDRHAEAIASVLWR